MVDLYYQAGEPGSYGGIRPLVRYSWFLRKKLANGYLVRMLTRYISLSVENFRDKKLIPKVLENFSKLILPTCKIYQNSTTGCDLF